MVVWVTVRNDVGGGVVDGGGDSVVGGLVYAVMDDGVDGVVSGIVDGGMDDGVVGGVVDGSRNDKTV